MISQRTAEIHIELLLSAPFLQTASAFSSTRAHSWSLPPTTLTSFIANGSRSALVMVPSAFSFHAACRPVSMHMDP